MLTALNLIGLRPVRYTLDGELSLCVERDRSRNFDIKRLLLSVLFHAVRVCEKLLSEFSGLLEWEDEEGILLFLSPLVPLSSYP